MIASDPAVRILVDYRPALRNRTGVGEYVHESVRALVRTAPAGESIAIFSSSWRDRLPADAVPGADAIDRHVPVRVLNFAWHRWSWPPVEMLAGPCDVAQSSHPLLMPASRAARLVTIYDLHYLDAPESAVREVRRDYPALSAAHARLADQIIVISNATATEVESKLGVERSRVSICRPGAPDWSRRAVEPLANGSILFLGTLGPRKNAGMLLDAYERLRARMPNAPPLVLAGAIPEDAAPLVARATRPPLAGHVELPGYVSDVARRALYARALVFVLPSDAEGFGMPVLEAMTVGVPVVVSNRGALPEVVGAAGIVIDSIDADQLASAIEALLADPARRRALSDAGVRQAAQFTWSDTARGMREAWAMALDRRRSRG